MPPCASRSLLRVEDDARTLGSPEIEPERQPSLASADDQYIDLSKRSHAVGTELELFASLPTRALAEYFKIV